MLHTIGFLRRLTVVLIGMLSLAGSNALRADSNTATAASPAIILLSNRADLISGGDALAQIAPDAVRVTRNGVDITPAFVAAKDGRRLGRITGLTLGNNDLVLTRADGSQQALTITNHPIGGPVFAGPQVQPWFCATQESGLGPPLDAQCNTPAVYRWKYKSAVTGQFAFV